MKIVFMGNPKFAVPSLIKLAASNHEILSVVTNPPKPVGRGRKLMQSPVAKCVEELNLHITEVEYLNDKKTIHILRELDADIFVVVAYRILPKDVFDIPENGAINLHGSLLPKYRGAAPIQWSLINGDQETGLTTFIIEPKVDKGRILLQKKININQIDTYGSLYTKMSELGAELLVETLDSFEKGIIEECIQDESNATKAPKISTSIAVIDWNKSAHDIHNLIRGLTPFPGARTVLNGKNIKLFNTTFIDQESTFKVGEISHLEKESFTVQTGHGQIVVEEVQLEGKRHMKTSDYLRGVHLLTGTRLS